MGAVGAGHLVVDPPLAIHDKGVKVAGRAASLRADNPGSSGGEPLPVPQVAGGGNAAALLVILPCAGGAVVEADIAGAHGHHAGQPGLVGVPAVADIQDRAVPLEAEAVQAGGQPGRMSGHAGVVDVAGAVRTAAVLRREGPRGGEAGEQVGDRSEAQRIGVFDSLGAGAGCGERRSCAWYGEAAGVGRLQHVNPPPVVSRVDIADVEAVAAAGRRHQREPFHRRRIQVILADLPDVVEMHPVAARCERAAPAPVQAGTARPALPVAQQESMAGRLVENPRGSGPVTGRRALWLPHDHAAAGIKRRQQCHDAVHAFSSHQGPCGGHRETQGLRAGVSPAGGGTLSWRTTHRISASAADERR